MGNKKQSADHPPQKPDEVRGSGHISISVWIKGDSKIKVSPPVEGGTSGIFRFEVDEEEITFFVDKEKFVDFYECLDKLKLDVSAQRYLEQRREEGRT